MLWTIRNTHLLEMFGWKEPLPSYVVAAPSLWWLWFKRACGT
jgi:hypothetical protein